MPLCIDDISRSPGKEAVIDSLTKATSGKEAVIDSLTKATSGKEEDKTKKISDVEVSREFRVALEIDGCAAAVEVCTNTEEVVEIIGTEVEDVIASGASKNVDVDEVYMGISFVVVEDVYPGTPTTTEVDDAYDRSSSTVEEIFILVLLTVMGDSNMLIALPFVEFAEIEALRSLDTKAGGVVKALDVTMASATIVDVEEVYTETSPIVVEGLSTTIGVVAETCKIVDVEEVYTGRFFIVVVELYGASTTAAVEEVYAIGQEGTLQVPVRVPREVSQQTVPLIKQPLVKTKV